LITRLLSVVRHAQLDPLTGQVQNAQIFFQSAFYLDNGTILLSTFESRVNKPARKATNARTSPTLDEAGTSDVDDSVIRPRGRFAGGCKLASAPGVLAGCEEPVSAGGIRWVHHRLRDVELRAATLGSSGADRRARATLG
jgi:hypothetical protein